MLAVELWKQLITRYLQEYLLLCWPGRAETIDWSAPFGTLDAACKSLNIETDGIGTEILARFQDGKEREHWVLCHFQLGRTTFEVLQKRLFSFSEKISTRYKKNCLHLIFYLSHHVDVFLQDNAMEKWKKTAEQEIDILHIQEFTQDLQDLTLRDTPIAFMILVRLLAIDLRSDVLQRQLLRANLLHYVSEHTVWSKEDKLLLQSLVAVELV